MYARLEEDHGLARHAMAIYDRATRAVLPEEQFEVHGLINISVMCTCGSCITAVEPRAHARGKISVHQ